MKNFWLTFTDGTKGFCNGATPFDAKEIAEKMTGKKVAGGSKPADLSASSRYACSDGSPGKTWNPIVGCSIISPGCTNCYAMRMASRINKMTPASHYEGLTQFVNGRPVWTGKIARAPHKIFNAPLKWKKPSLVFVNSMSDLFHEDVPDEWIDRVFAIMALSPQHTFQVLTKRAARMHDYCSSIQKNGTWLSAESFALDMGFDPRGRDNAGFDWLANHQMLPNVWLGVSVEDQARADERIPLLLDTPAAVRFISAEPLLGKIDLEPYPLPASQWGAGWLNNYPYRYPKQHLAWVIIGGESGPGKRPVDLAWMRSIRDQCQAAGVPLFVKQIDKRIPIPDDLMIREFPL